MIMISAGTVPHLFPTSTTMANFLSLKSLKSFMNFLPRIRRRNNQNKIPQSGLDRMVNTHGLPGDKQSDMPHVLSVLSEALDDAQICWFLAGDLLLNHYHVAKVTFVKALSF